MLSDELKKRNFDSKKYMEKNQIEAICGQFGVSKYNDLMYAIAQKSVSLSQVVDKLTNQKQVAQNQDNEAFSKMLQERSSPKKITSRNAVQVSGIDNMKINIAGCCMPVYGDEIVGFITKGNGVSVHRKDCPNIQGKDKQSRLISVHWEDSDANLEYDCWLTIDAIDRGYLISDIVTVLAQYKAQLTGINSEVLPDKVNVTIDVKIRVKNAEQVRLIIANLRKLDNVVDVIRVVK